MHVLMVQFEFEYYRHVILKWGDWGHEESGVLRGWGLPGLMTRKASQPGSAVTSDPSPTTTIAGFGILIIAVIRCLY